MLLFTVLLYHAVGVKSPSIVPWKVHIFCNKYKPKWFTCCIIEISKPLANDKNVELITTSLTGKTAPDIIADFEFNKEGTQVLKCPARHAPKSCSYKKQSDQCAVSFLHEQYATCPYQKQCKPKIFKWVAKIVTSKAAYERAKIQRRMSIEEFKNYARLRNGAETVPSKYTEELPFEKDT